MKRSESYEDFCEADNALMEFRQIRRTLKGLALEYEVPKDLIDDVLKLEDKLTEFTADLYLDKVESR